MGRYALGNDFCMRGRWVRTIQKGLGCAGRRVDTGADNEIRANYVEDFEFCVDATRRR